MRLTVDLVDVALDLGLREQLIVDVPLCVCVLQLLETYIRHVSIMTCSTFNPAGRETC